WYSSLVIVDDSPDSLRLQHLLTVTPLSADGIIGSRRFSDAFPAAAATASRRRAGGQIKHGAGGSVTMNSWYDQMIDKLLSMGYRYPTHAEGYEPGFEWKAPGETRGRGNNNREPFRKWPTWIGSDPESPVLSIPRDSNSSVIFDVLNDATRFRTRVIVLHCSP